CTSGHRPENEFGFQHRGGWRLGELARRSHRGDGTDRLFRSYRMRTFWRTRERSPLWHRLLRDLLGQREWQLAAGKHNLLAEFRLRGSQYYRRLLPPGRRI